MSFLRSGIDPTIKALLDTLDSLGRPEVYELSVEEARAEMSRAQAGDVVKLPADIEAYKRAVTKLGGKLKED